MAGAALGGSGLAIGGDRADDRIHADGGTFRDFDFLQDAGGGRGNFRVDFVGGNFEERFVALNFVAGFFSHLVIVPSTMDSPIWGMMMSVGMISFHAAHSSNSRAGCNRIL